ncbi:sulfite exporter TauE/SafE family protein [Flavobacterium sp. SM15]|uniref:sulfite exporter TauE/SafE family protein n=1 Tax=Flavobacterium sp. SM15 TaxID=2908005 RepID=UPI001ED9E250|nr:sulfite exporter TauE/SafE family protein [Flavobacterium sp. SM15]MCG2612329.1 sulfite exporter TauE/SafE family protein [Flavobacterium sp. SM15]
MEVFGYFGALVIGLILGLTGGGGSILTVPLLVYALGFNPVTATAYSLFIVGTTSAFGATQNFFKGFVDLKKGFLFAIPSFITVYLTRRYIVPALPDTILETSFFSLTKEIFLMVLFAVIMLFAALSMLRKRKEVVINTDSDSKIKFLLQTIIVGLLIGLVGAGGGFLIIPSLVFFAKLPMRKAVATSLMIIALNSLIGFMGDVQNLTIDWQFLLIFTSISVVGIFIGIYLNKFLNDTQLKKGFGYFVLLMALFILSKELLGM